MMTSCSSPEPSEFETLSREKEHGLLYEIWTFMKEEKLWWMSPIIIVLLAAAVLISLTSTGAAPFIYTLF
jgi:hypothetical protein